MNAAQGKLIFSKIELGNEWNHETKEGCLIKQKEGGSQEQVILGITGILIIVILPPITLGQLFLFWQFISVLQTSIFLKKLRMWKLQVYFHALYTYLSFYPSQASGLGLGDIHPWPPGWSCWDRTSMKQGTHWFPAAKFKGCPPKFSNEN